MSEERLTKVSDDDLYEVARFVGIPGTAMQRLIGCLRVTGAGVYRPDVSPGEISRSGHGSNEKNGSSAPSIERDR